MRISKKSRAVRKASFSLDAPLAHKVLPDMANGWRRAFSENLPNALADRIKIGGNMDTKKEIAKIMRDVAAVQTPDLRLPGAETKIQIPNHFAKSGVTSSPAAGRAEHAENDRRKVAPPIVRKP